MCAQVPGTNQWTVPETSTESISHLYSIISHCPHCYSEFQMDLCHQGGHSGSLR